MRGVSLTTLPPVGHRSRNGEPALGDHPQGLMVVQPDGSAIGKVTYYFGEHSPNPPTPERLADPERQEIEAAAASVLSQEELIRQ